MLEDLIAGWDGEEMVIRFDRPAGTWMFICVHSTVLGPAAGGTRIATYPAPADGLADAMRLSAAMTWKMAVLGTPFGGGKAVLAVPEIPPGAQRRSLLLRYGDMVASLRGTYRTAADMNTSAGPADCRWCNATTNRAPRRICAMAYHCPPQYSACSSTDREAEPGARIG